MSRTIRLLGAPVITRDDGPVDRPRGRKTWGVLAYLALADGSGGVAAAPVMPGVRGARIFRSGYERFDILTDQRRERAPYPGMNRPGLSEGSGLLLAFETGDLLQAECGESGDPIPSSLATS
ncbi:MAG: hypothetical protein M3387_02610, partial [Actinomycetota bacterium]|nr:hypothetical protein [Actinomycetota bacterium]